MQQFLLCSALALATIEVMAARTIGPININLPEMNVSGSGGLPLGRAAGGGYQYVLTQVSVVATASGITTLSTGSDAPITQGTVLDVAVELSGSATVTFTDIDPAFSFFGLPTTFQRTVSFSNSSEPGVCSADLTRPNYGCFPPVGLPLMGAAPFRVNLPADINGNLLLDFMSVDPPHSQVGNLHSSVQQGSTVSSTFAVSASLEGAVQDQGGQSPVFARTHGPREWNSDGRSGRGPRTFHRLATPCAHRRFAAVPAAQAEAGCALAVDRPVQPQHVLVVRRGARLPLAAAR